MYAKAGKLMADHRGCGAWLSAVLLAVIGIGVHAQQPYQQRFQRGQNVVPVYEGWELNPDGTFKMYFGYLNRNYEEEIYIPIGAENVVEPGGDQGQPTHFIPRALQSDFTVTVPRDWGNKEVVWTLTAHGRTEKAYGSLLRTWEISSGEEGLPTYSRTPNKPPEITIGSASHAANVGKPYPLTVAVSDDGISEPSRGTNNTAGPGLEVIWTAYRGLGTVAFPSRRTSVIANRVTTHVTFGAVGSYVLRIFASDGRLTSQLDVTVSVSP